MQNLSCYFFVLLRTRYQLITISALNWKCTVYILLRNTPLRGPSTTPMAVESFLDVRTATMGESSLLTVSIPRYKGNKGKPRLRDQKTLDAAFWIHREARIGLNRGHRRKQGFIQLVGSRASSEIRRNNFCT